MVVGDGFRRRPIVAAGLRLSKRELDDRLLVWCPVRELNPPLRLEGPRTSPEVQRDVVDVVDADGFEPPCREDLVYSQAQSTNSAKRP